MPLPRISEAQILARVGKRSFERGLDYFRAGAIFDTRRQGATLKAHCQGSRAEAYRVSATLGKSDVASADCSCPVGSGGYCKHVAALLLTWLNQPEQFREIPELDTDLEARSKAELIALIKQMLQRAPDLEILLETPLPVPGQRRAPVDPAIYRRQAAAAFHGAGDDGGDYSFGASVAAELGSIVDIARGFAKLGDAISAYRVYDAVLDAIGDNYEGIEDEEGDVALVAQDCIEGLADCLELAGDDAATREAILRTMLAAYQADLAMGGVGLADAVPALVRERATPAEQREVAGWLRQELDREGSSNSDWARSALAGFLLELEQETLDDEEFIRICRDTARWHDLLPRLLDLGRVDEALAVVAGLASHAVLSFADLFIAHGHGAAIEALLAERVRQSDDVAVLEWLRKRHEERGDLAGAIVLAERSFRARPSLEGYQRLRSLSQSVGGWEARRSALLGVLAEQRRFDLIARIYLEDGEIDRALELVPRFEGSGSPYGLGLLGDIVLEIARAAETARPRAAREIYRNRAERLIELRGRDNYRAACELLQRGRRLSEELGEAAEWSSYLEALRERNRSLRALKEELAVAGL